MGKYDFNGNVKAGNKPFNEWDQKCAEIKQLRECLKDALDMLQDAQSKTLVVGIGSVIDKIQKTLI